MFGKANSQCLGSSACTSRYSINGGLVTATELILGPTLHIGAVQMDTVMDNAFFVYPAKTRDNNLNAHLDNLSSALPAGTIQLANNISDQELSKIVQNLRATTFWNQGTRTDKIGQVWTGTKSVAIEGFANCVVTSPGLHNTIGASNGDERFLCFNGRWHDCGWEYSDPNWETKIANLGVIGSFQCNLAQKKWQPVGTAEGTSNCVNVTTGVHNAVGASLNGDTRFLCFNNRWYDCGWEFSDPTWETKAAKGQRVGAYTCSSNGGWTLNTDGSGTGNCIVGMNPGTHNLRGAANNDFRFQCLGSRWYDCNWADNDPSWETKVPLGKRVGSFTCMSGVGWSP